MQRSLVVTTALALTAVASPQGRAQQTRLGVPYERFVLPNGLTVILHEDHTRPSVAVVRWYHVGSARDAPGRTGFAHLFEHLMLFGGSGHAPESKGNEWLDAAGATGDGGVSLDHTSYWLVVPSDALALALFVESDRMGFLLDGLTPAKFANQRDVVMNERRMAWENRPYGLAPAVLLEHLNPPGHPYRWPWIGSMADLSAATYEDAVAYYRAWYAPSNAVLAITGDIDTAQTRQLVAHWFGDVIPGPAVAPVARPAAWLFEERRVVLEAQVELPRLYMCWLAPAVLAPGEAALDVAASALARGRSSRLEQRLVHDMQVAQDVSSETFAEYGMQSGELGSQFCLSATARAGHALGEIERAVQEELDRLKAEGPTAREVERAVHQRETLVLSGLESLVDKAHALAAYHVRTGDADYFHEDLARYQALGPDDVRAVVQAYLRDDARVILSVVPQGRPDLAAAGPRRAGPP